MTTPQDAPAGPVLGPSTRRDIERLVYMADHRWRGHVDSWAQDFAEQVPVLLAEIDRLTALLSSAREGGAAAERERIVREIEALIGEESAAPGSPAADREWGAYGAFRMAARIARRADLYERGREDGRGDLIWHEERVRRECAATVHGTISAVAEMGESAEVAVDDLRAKADEWAGQEET